MKYLYELTLNNRELIISKVEELCDGDACINRGCESDEMIHRIIHILYNTILEFLKNQTWESGRDTLYASLGDIAGRINVDNIRSFLLRGIDIKLLIAILKYFRSSIYNTMFQILSDKDTLYSRIDSTNKYFDSLELSLYDHWQIVEKGDVLHNKMLDQTPYGENEISSGSSILGTAIDISNCKKIEELKLQVSESRERLNEVLEQEKIRTEFYSNLSHELRTPLNVILGTLQLVDMFSAKNSDSIIDKTKKYYKIMRQNCYRLLRLVNNLVDLNKLDAGYFYLNMENHDIVGIVSQIATSVSDYVENKGIGFLYCSKTDSKIIACDPDKIERILLNLLSNAIKFTDSGGKITVNVWDEDSKIYISVKDNGIGIPKEKQDLVFKRFVQIEKSLSRNHHGSGIGLSLAKSLVELHGGKISLISDTGQGCEFILELPIIQMSVMELSKKESQYNSNNKIEVINIEFSDIYS